ncbi:hypothetical protein GOODEAATRI_026559 [Goodea atripinnis]|uniref:Uncharacterized protein n=1 Tax=Goodea atripinnis TaxID=208336 RepID=A0ABV0N6U9_9TELE
MELIMSDMLKTQMQHKEKLIEQEAMARCQNIRIHNVPEGEEGNSMVTYVENLLTDPSIHPLSSAYPGSGRGGSSLSRETQTSLSPATWASSSGGIPRHSQASRET